MMLDFIKNNAVLCTGAFSIISALISAIVTLIVNRNSERNKTIDELKNELKETKKDLLDAENNLHKSETRLNEYKSVEFAEKNLDKSHGGIYKEKLSDGNTRDICAYCWEKDHKKIPINPRYIYNDNGEIDCIGDRCLICNKFCQEDYIITDDDLPF